MVCGLFDEGVCGGEGGVCVCSIACLLLVRKKQITLYAFEKTHSRELRVMYARFAYDTLRRHTPARTAPS